MSGFEDGIVAHLKDKYGFINTRDREEGTFFSLDEWPSSSIPQLGDSVQFRRSTRGKKTFATDIHVLPRGTVQEREVSPPLQGTCVARGGRGVTHIEAETEDGKRSVKVPRTIADQFVEGDVVQFCVSTGMRRDVSACRIEIVSFGGERERGVVASWKDTFGFIRRVAHKDNIYFHESAVINNHLGRGSRLLPGTPVEFSVVSAPSRRRGAGNALETAAQRVCVLPRDTVINFERTIAASFTGRIRDVPVRGGRRGVVVVVSCTPDPKSDDADEATALIGKSLGFGERDLNLRESLGVDDTVSLTVVVPLTGKGTHATKVDLVERAPPKYRHGVVAVILSNKESGFLHMVNGDEVFFRLASVEGDQSVVVGTCVRAVVDEVRRKKDLAPTALKVEILPAGSVTFFEDVESDGPLVGQIVRVAKPRTGSAVRDDSRGKLPPGRIRVGNDEYAYAHEALVADGRAKAEGAPLYDRKRPVLCVGDTVSFSLEKHTVHDCVRAKAIVWTQCVDVQSGLVVSASARGGTLLPDGESAVVTFEARNVVSIANHQTWRFLEGKSRVTFALTAGKTACRVRWDACSPAWALGTVKEVDDVDGAVVAVGTAESLQSVRVVSVVDGYTAVVGDDVTMSLQEENGVFVASEVAKKTNMAKKPAGAPQEQRPRLNIARRAPEKEAGRVWLLREPINRDTTIGFGTNKRFFTAADRLALLHARNGIVASAVDVSDGGESVDDSASDHSLSEVLPPMSIAAAKASPFSLSNASLRTISMTCSVGSEPASADNDLVVDSLTPSSAGGDFD